MAISPYISRKDYRFLERAVDSEKLSVHTQHVIADSGERMLSHSLLDNRHTDPEVLRKLHGDGSNRHVNQLLAYHPNTPTDVLDKISHRYVDANRDFNRPHYNSDVYAMMLRISKHPNAGSDAKAKAHYWTRII